MRRHRHLLWFLSTEDAHQLWRIAGWVTDDLVTGRQVARHRVFHAMADRCLRALGWRRVRRPDGTRTWMRETAWLSTVSPQDGYRHGGRAAKRASRLAMPTKRRAEIARKGGKHARTRTTSGGRQ